MLPQSEPSRSLATLIGRLVCCRRGPVGGFAVPVVPDGDPRDFPAGFSWGFFSRSLVVVSFIFRPGSFLDASRRREQGRASKAVTMALLQARLLSGSHRGAGALVPPKWWPFVNH